MPFGFTRLFNSLIPGTHNVKLYWKRVTAGTATLYAGAGTGNNDTHPEFSVIQVKP
jgi:hypothetical protein